MRWLIHEQSIQMDFPLVAIVSNKSVPAYLEVLGYILFYSRGERRAGLSAMHCSSWSGADRYT